MRNVLADLCVESEAATISALRLARAYDEAIAGDERGRSSFKRIANAVLKYWICKRAPVHAGEALECLGGNGYVEESGMPRLFRESPLNSIWEGSGNVQCLDVLRAMVKSPAALDAFFAEVEEGAGRRAAPRRLRHRRCAPSCPATSRRSRPGPAASSSAWPSPSRPRCWSATATRPSPTPSAPPAWPATGATPSAPCPPAPTSAASSSATARSPSAATAGPAPEPSCSRR